MNEPDSDTVCQMVENDQGFLIMMVSRLRLEKATEQERCVCDNCLRSPQVGYYVSVLNSFLCPQCYKRWIATAINYPEDRKIEQRNFWTYATLLGFAPTKENRVRSGQNGHSHGLR